MSKVILSTASGVVIDFENPWNMDIRWEDLEVHAQRICRYNGARPVFLDVHLALCVRLAGLFEPKNRRLKGLMGLHDLPECYLGDVQTGLKDLLPEYRVIEDRFERRIFDRFRYSPMTADEKVAMKHIDLRALVTEMTMTRHPIVEYAQTCHGGPPTRPECAAWDDVYQTLNPARRWESVRMAVEQGADPHP